MNKWQREVIKIEKLADKDMTVGMYKMYDEALKDIQKKIKVYVKDYGELPYYKQQELGKLKAIEKELVEVVSEVYADTRETINRHKLSELENGYYSTMFQLENETGRMLPFMGLESELMAQSVHHPIAGKSLVRRLGTSRDKLAKRATSELRNGMIQGKGYAQIAKAISAHTDANYKQALRIARTEGGVWRSRAKQVAYQEASDMGIDLKKRWYASLDNRTRSSHQALDGQEREIEDDFVSPDTGARGPGPRLLGRASEDINCRCTTITVVDGIAPDSRLAKGADGYENIKYKNYDDWLGKRVKKDYNVGEGIPLLAGVFVEYALDKVEVVARLADEFGMKISETSRTKLSEVSLNQTYSILERFKPLYNALPEKIPEIKALTKKDAKGAIAHYSSYRTSRTPVRFGINGEYFKTNDTLEAIVKRNVDNGWFGKNSNANHIMMHEFSHHVDFQLSKINGGSISDLIVENMVTKYSDKYDKYTFARKVSGYSGSYYDQYRDHTETFAELFAEAYGETPREIALDFKDEFERLAERVIEK